MEPPKKKANERDPWVSSASTGFRAPSRDATIKGCAGVEELGDSYFQSASAAIFNIV